MFHVCNFLSVENHPGSLLNNVIFVSFVYSKVFILFFMNLLCRMPKDVIYVTIVSIF